MSLQVLLSVLVALPPLLDLSVPIELSPLIELPLVVELSRNERESAYRIVYPNRLITLKGSEDEPIGP